MSHQIGESELFIDLSNEQQEVVAGGEIAPSFELSNTYFNQSIPLLTGATFSGPGGSSSNSFAAALNISTAAQDFLGLNVPSIPKVGALDPGV